MTDNSDLPALHTLADDAQVLQALAIEYQGHPDAFKIAQIAEHVRHAVDALAARPGALKAPLPWWADRSTE